MDKILSASKAGFPCLRNLWYTVNGFAGSENDTHTQRIFDVGTCLEPVIVDWLRWDGWLVDYNPGSQQAALEVSIPVKGGKLTGHHDCIISKGNVQNALVDIKTMNDRAFNHWKHNGTLNSKPQYVVQLHVYAMGLTLLGKEIERLGIVGINKNNSEMFIDFFPFDGFIAESITDKAERLFALSEPPKLNCPSETWACNYCEYSSTCELHRKNAPVTVNNEPLSVTEDEDIINAMKMLKQAREMSSEAKELEQLARATLDENVKDKGLSGICGGGLVFSMKERSSSRFDTTAFKKAHPELVCEFTKTSFSTIYEIKEAI